MQADRSVGGRVAIGRLSLPLRPGWMPDHIPTAPGTQLSVTTQDGQNVPVVVSDATETHVELDGNHPLAGKTLTFDVTLVEIA